MHPTIATRYEPSAIKPTSQIFLFGSFRNGMWVLGRRLHNSSNLALDKTPQYFSSLSMNDAYYRLLN